MLNATQTLVTITLTADVQSITNKGNPGEFDAEQYWLSKTFHSMHYSKRTIKLKTLRGFSFKQFLEKQTGTFLKNLTPPLRPSESQLAKALILGDKSRLPRSN